MAREVFFTYGSYWYLTGKTINRGWAIRVVIKWSYKLCLMGSWVENPPVFKKTFPKRYFKPTQISLSAYGLLGGHPNRS